MIRKRLTKVILGLALVVGLMSTSVPTQAYVTGWHKYSTGEEGLVNYYWYTNLDGTSAKGWNLIDNVWYYFAPEGEGYVTIAGMSEYVDGIAVLHGDGIPVDGKNYYFDREGRLIRNTMGILRSGRTVWIDANGHIV